MSVKVTDIEEMAEDVSDTSTTEVAILLDDAVNKYHPGMQVFRLQSLNGLQENSNAISTIPVNIPQLMNKDDDLGLTDVRTTACLKLELPREVVRNYPLKYIPAGTRFIVSFNSGDITKPVIVGREYN